MITAKELLKHFRAADWTDNRQVEAFVQAASQLPASDFDPFLELLTSRRMVQDQVRHRNRCAIFAKMVELRADKALFLPLVKALKVGDSNLRSALVPVMPKVNNIARHPELCELLRSPDAILRDCVAKVLKQIAGKTAMRVLMQLVGEPSFEGRREALSVLLEAAGHYAIPALAKVLEVGTLEEKRLALGYLSEPRYMSRDRDGALAAIVAAVEDRHEEVAQEAVRAYCSLCDESDYFRDIAPMLDSTNVPVACAAILGLGRFRTRRAIAALERKLRQGPNKLRLTVLDTLASIGSDEVLPPLVYALGHRQIAVRTRAGEVLSELSRAGKIDMARTLIWLLRSGDVNVRRMAAEVARTVKDAEGKIWPKLVSFLKDEDWWVRERVTDALIHIAGQQITRHVASFLTDESDVVRRFAVTVLGRLKDARALGALVRAAREDTDWWVREKAIEAIAELQDERAVPYILDLMTRHPELHLVSIYALHQLKAREAAPHVAALLQSEDPDVRLSCLKALETFNDASQGQAVGALINDEDVQVRTHARNLVARWNITGFDEAEENQAVTILDRLLIAAAKGEGDDLIISSGKRPYVKRLGKVIPLAKNIFTEDQVRALLSPHLSLAQLEGLEALRDADFSYEVHSENLRFRANVFTQHGGLSAVFRLIKDEIFTLDELGLPEVVRRFGDLKNGLVLVGGPTGSGKSTTLAALIDYINRTYARHVVTLEDPIEVLHPAKKGMVNQRELGTHTGSFDRALRSTLRQDPDVILVGEMRDLPTISFAVSAAETGHLVFGTVHTVSADSTMDRLINAFPPRQQEQVRYMLAESLRAVVCQFLLRRKDEPGRVPALEIMLNNDAIANLVRKGKTFQIPSVIATHREFGMRLMDHELRRLYDEGKVHADEVYVKALNKKEFEDLVKDEEADEEIDRLLASEPAA